VASPSRLGARARGVRVVSRIEFAELADGEGWGPGWETVGVANLRRAGGTGILEAGSDVFPNDPRPVAFALETGIRDVAISAELGRIGLAPGVVVRRTGTRSYYAAIYDTARLELRIVRRDGAALDRLASVPVIAAGAPASLHLEARGSHPTELHAELVGSEGLRFTASARDGTERLQGRGGVGVLATADTLFPSDRNPVLPALGNLHLLPWGVQQGQAFMNTALGRELVDEIRRRSTAAFRAIEVRSPERPRPLRPSIVAATTGAPVPGGARLHVAADADAVVELELSYSARFRESWRVPVGRTDRFHAAATTVRGLAPGRRVYWRARARRGRASATGPPRSFRVLPDAASGASSRIAIGSCASQFGPIFGELAARRPDVFVWQGDLNYPDTHGPLAQTVGGYAGIWRDFLANPLLAPLLQRASFAVQRDDHDYGVQDANSTNIGRFPWALSPWSSLMSRRLHYRFRAGAAEVWVLDQRRHKDDPDLPDTPAKTLLGSAQRRWLLRTLAASDARFKVICSPTTVLVGGNSSDGNWSAGYEAERRVIFDHIGRTVSGTVIFVTGDTHLTAVYDQGPWFECRAAPLGIPVPNDITLVDPLAASSLRTESGIEYADERSHFALLEVRGRGPGARLDLQLVREDGATPYERTFG
jgi:hypothetical protein